MLHILNNWNDFREPYIANLNSTEEVTLQILVGRERNRNAIIYCQYKSNGPVGHFQYKFTKLPEQLLIWGFNQFVVRNAIFLKSYIYSPRKMCVLITYFIGKNL